MARSRFVGSGREKEGGFLALHKQDFEAHRTGGNWRHEADQVDMNPQLTRFPSPTVQGTLESIGAFLDGGVSSFISIGGGYARGDYNVGDPGIPTLEAAFTAALASSRLQNGGTILVKPGKFSVSSTIVIPEGISIMGDLAGTYIDNPATDAPIFRIERATQYFDIGNVPVSGLENVQSTSVNRIFNLILTDNWEDGSGTGTTVAMQTTPMIRCDLGSNVEIERVTFLGRTGDGGPTKVTHRGISYTTMANPGTPTILKVKNCYFDAVKTAIEFEGEEGVKDHLRVEGCRARTLGLLGGPPDTAFVYFNLCNAHLINNHHIGDRTNFQSVSCFNISSFSPTSDEIQVVIMGNSGGLTDTSSSANDNLLIDFRGTKNAYRGTITGNSWGIKYNNDWFMTVGDGTSSVGDVTGTNALDLAILRSRNSADSAWIVVNPGNYTLTETGTSVQRPKLMGNPRATKPIINVNGSSTAGRQSHYGINVGMELHNLTFNASGALQTLKMYTGDPEDKRWKVSNCEFNNVTLNVEQTDDADYTGVEIENCEFNQTGAYDNTVSLLLSEATRYIQIASCYFHTYGYAIYIGDVSSTPRFQRINIERCRFEGAVGTGIKSIEDNSPLGSQYNYYMWIANGNRSSDVTFRDCMLRFVSDTPGNNYEPLDTTIIQKLIKVLCGTLTVDNSKFFGPYQYYADSGNWALPTWYIAATRSVQLINSRFFGSLPVKITGADSGLDNPHNVRSQFGDGAFLRIDGCEFSSYEEGITAFWAPTALDVELEPFSGTVGTSNGMVNVTNSSFFSTRASLTTSPIAAQHDEYTGFTDYHTMGCVQIYGEGWGVHFSGNDVNVLYSSSANASFAGHAAVVLDVISNAGSDLKGSCAVVDGNRIYLNTYWNASLISYMDAVVAKAQHPTITGNHIRYYTTSSTGSRRLIFTEADGGYTSAGTITGNTFFFNGTVPTSSIFNFVGGRGICADNALDLSTIWFTSATTNTNWIIERNKGQQVTEELSMLEGVHARAGAPAITSDSLTYMHYPVNLTSASGIRFSGGGAVTYTFDDNYDSLFVSAMKLSDMIPLGSKIVSVQVNYDPNSWTTMNSAEIDFGIYETDGQISSSSVTKEVATKKVITTSTEDTISHTFTGDWFSKPRNLFMIRVWMDPNGTANVNFEIEKVFVTYRW